MNTLQKEIDHHLPVQTTMIKYEKLRREPWITNALMKSMNKSHQLYRKQLAGDETTRQQYKHYNDVLKKVKRHAKKQYYIDRCMEYRSNTRQLWKTINKIVETTHDKSTVVTSLVDDSGRITNPKQIANKFGSYFSTVGSTFAKKITTADKNIDDYLKMIRRNQESLYFTPTTPNEVERLIRKLPNKRSHGHDNIDNILLKQIASSISDILCAIFNTSLTKGLFPDIFKIAEVVPLHKSNSKEQVENYRPISLLVTISKLLEKIVYSRIYNFLDQTNQLFQSQYGFRTNHGCDHAVSELLSEIVKNLECNRPTTCIFLDLSKAFDTLLHEVILKKMKRYGIRGICLEWLQSYLSNRKMLVKCKENNGTNVKSDLYDIHYGTPQGSCMGPLLFLVFCNDLQLNLQHLRTIQFADDTTLYFSHRNQNYTQFCIADDLTRIEDWFKANKLTLNASKTVAMKFNTTTKSINTKSSNDIPLVINNTPIPYVESTKFLGIWIDQHLTWRTHLSKITNRIKTKLCMLQRGKHILTAHAKKILYFAQIQSILTYGLVIWGNMITESQLSHLQKLQDKCVQLISPRRNTNNIYEEHKILNLKELLLLENVKTWYKHKTKILPMQLYGNMSNDAHHLSLFKTHKYDTRNKEIINMPLAKNKRYKTSFLSKGLLDFINCPYRNQECFKSSDLLSTTKKGFIKNPMIPTIEL